MISIFPFRDHAERFLFVEKLKIADWMAPKKDMIAVLEYWQGYLLPIVDCKRNHEDQKKVPTTKAIEPSVHLSVFLVELSLIA